MTIRYCATAEAQKAFTVDWESDEGRHTEVLYSSSLEEARNDAAEYMLRIEGLGEDDVEYQVEARPSLDGLASLDDLNRAQVASGWSLPCFECQRSVLDGGDEEEDEDDVPRRPKTPVFRKGSVYCGADCCIVRLVRERTHRENEWLVAEEACSKWPGIEIDSVHGGTFGEAPPFDQVVVGHTYFRFPGGQGLVRWTRYAPSAWVEMRDLEAWDTFTATLRRTDP